MANPFNIFKKLFGPKPAAAPSREGDALAEPMGKPVTQTRVEQEIGSKKGTGDILLPVSSASGDAAPPPIGDEQSAIGHPPASRSILHVLNEIRFRVHALAVLLLVSWAGYLAVDYLMHTVFMQTPVPRRFLEWQGRSDAAALRATSAAGVTGFAERAPIAHYHRVRPWFQPDSRNGCTVAGCHDPLPHSKRTKIPAFANFHATFLSCQMCHAPADGGPSAVTWVGIADAQRQDPPSMIQLLRYLDTSQDKITTQPAEAHKIILPLLRGTLAALGDDPVLKTLLLQIETSEPLSPVWRQAVDQLTLDLPFYARGEYGAKLARETVPGAYLDASQRMQDLAKRYIENYSDTAQRKELHQAIHASLLKEPVTCLSCHGDTPALNYPALGYSPRRAKLLGSLQLARLMQQIRQGEQFHIPKLLGSGNDK